MMDNYGFPQSSGPVPNPRVPLSAQAAILQNEYAKVLAQPDSPYRTQNLNALTSEMQRYRIAPSMNLASFTAGLPTQAPQTTQPSSSAYDLDAFTSGLPVQAPQQESSAAPGALTPEQSANRSAWGIPYLPDAVFGARRAWDGAAQMLASAFGHGNDVATVAQDAQQQFQRNYGALPASSMVQSAAQFLPAFAIPIAGEGGLLATAVRMGAQGAAGNLLQPEPPSSGSDYLKAKGAEAASGAVVNGLLGGTLGGVAKVFGPTKSASALMSEGINPTIGQTMGGAWKALEEKATSIPILGDAIKSAQASGLDDFNRAIYNRILSPLGQKYSGPVGQPALASLRNTLGAAYDDTLSKMAPSPLTNEFAGGVDSLRSMLASRPNALQAFDNAINGDLWPRFTEANTLPPSALKDADSALGSTVRDYIGSADPDQRLAARALSQAQSGLRQMGAQANPAQAPQLRAIDSGYSQLVQLQNAAKTVKVARNEGVVTPADYLRGIKSGDNSVRDNVFSSGRALNQDFAQNADKVLSNTYPDSGSIGRGLIAALAAHEIAPGVIPGVLGAALPYLPYIRGGALALSRAAGVAPRLAPLGALAVPALAPHVVAGPLSVSP